MKIKINTCIHSDASAGFELIPLRNANYVPSQMIYPSTKASSLQLHQAGCRQVEVAVKKKLDGIHVSGGI